MLSFGAYQSHRPENGPVSDPQFQRPGYVSCEQGYLQVVRGQQQKASSASSATGGLPLTPPGSPREDQPLVICESPQKSLLNRSIWPCTSRRDFASATTVNSACAQPAFDRSSADILNLSSINAYGFHSDPPVSDQQDDDSRSSSVGTLYGPGRIRSEKKAVPELMKDEKYYQRRKRNNLAAKKSRDSRKNREDQIAARAAFLEKDNAVLRAQVATLQEEAQHLRILLLQKRQISQLEPSALAHACGSM